MIKILIVDDSPTEIALIEHILSSAPDMAVIGIAKTGKEAIELTARLKPDLITMDIQMPVMDGLEATRIIMSENPTPIIVISSMINDESIRATFPILEVGALSALAKPVNVFAPSFTGQKELILQTIRSLAPIHVIKKTLKKVPVFTNEPKKIASTKTQPNYEVIVIGASVGGPRALKTILSQLPTNFPVPIIVIQHISKGFIKGFTYWLAENINLKVTIAVDNEVLRSGTVYIAPEQKNLVVARYSEHLISKLVCGDPELNFCPSITNLLQSVATVSGKKAIGILLTGMCDDGALGLLELKKAHGHTLIQDQESAVVFGMGAVAQSLNAVDRVIDLQYIAHYLMNICFTTCE